MLKFTILPQSGLSVHENTLRHKFLCTVIREMQYVHFTKLQKQCDALETLFAKSFTDAMMNAMYSIKGKTNKRLENPFNDAQFTESVIQAVEKAYIPFNKDAWMYFDANGIIVIGARPELFIAANPVHDFSKLISAFNGGKVASGINFEMVDMTRDENKNVLGLFKNAVNIRAQIMNAITIFAYIKNMLTDHFWNYSDFRKINDELTDILYNMLAEANHNALLFGNMTDNSTLIRQITRAIAFATCHTGRTGENSTQYGIMQFTTHNMETPGSYYSSDCQAFRDSIANYMNK